MRPGFRSRIFTIIGYLTVVCLCCVGSVRAFTRGASDFNVFYEAWKLVLQGRGLDVYHVSPDRYLYSPGFAWLLAPLGILPKSIALGIWCSIKIVLVGFFIKTLSEPWLKNHKGLSVFGVSAWGIVFVSRPLLIDFEYGQVNLMILGACLWGLIGHFKKETTAASDFLRWSVLTFAAAAKLFPLPLLVVPWFVKQGISVHKLKIERRAILFGLLTSLLIPLVSENWDGLWKLMFDWRDAIMAKGLPLESHNQSFTALLHHYLSGNPTAVLSEGGQPFWFGQSWLSPSQIGWLSLFWSSSTLGLLLGWIVSGSGHDSRQWIAVLVGLLIVPSHLIWKPYFVMSIPLAIYLLQKTHELFLDQQSQKKAQKNKIFAVLGTLVLFAGINLTGFDFLGHHWAAHFEAASVLLIAHLILLIFAMKNVPSSFREKWMQAS